MAAEFSNSLLHGDDSLKQYLESHDAMRDAARLKQELEGIDELERRLSALRTDFKEPCERFMAIIVALQWKAWLVKIGHCPVSHLFTPCLEPRLGPVRTMVDVYLHRDLSGFNDAATGEKLAALRSLTEAAQIRFGQSPTPLTTTAPK